jgi:hypothetical protein
VKAIPTETTMKIRSGVKAGVVDNNPLYGG